MLSLKIICWDQVLFVWDMGGQRLPHQNRTKTILVYNKDRIRIEFGQGGFWDETTHCRGESGIGLIYHKFQIRVITKPINISVTLEQIN